jgi:hypothetical protein
LGYVEDLPLFWLDIAAAARARDPQTGYHAVYAGAYERSAGIAAPLSALQPDVAASVARAGLLDDPLADLCLQPSSPSATDKELVIHTIDREWRARAERRTRLLMRRAERRVVVRAATRMHAETRDGWLLQDGGLARLMERADPPERWARVVGCVKTHTRAPFGVAGEQALAALRLGQRSMAFQMRPVHGRYHTVTVDATRDPHGQAPIAWYLRVRLAPPQATRLLAGVVRLEIAPTPDWRHWIEPLSWAVLDEFWTLPADPTTDPRADVSCYGIRECEQYLRATTPAAAALAPRESKRLWSERPCSAAPAGSASRH